MAPAAQEAARPSNCREVAARRRAGVDAEAEWQVDPDVGEFADGFFAFERPDFFGRVLDDEMGEADRRVGGGGFEELARGVDTAGRQVNRAGAGLPAVFRGI